MVDYDGKYSGEQIDALLDQVASGNAGGGGGGGIAVETDPVFSASPAASITDEKMVEWDNKYTKPSGGIPQSDLAEEVITALRKAEQYTGTVNEIKVNGNNIGASGGVVDLGNLGTYSKPSTGIPKTDLASDVQTTLDNAATFVVAAFDLSAIYSGDDIVYPGKDVLMNAIREGKAVRIPLFKDSLENGYVIAQAYCEDLLYMTIADSHSLINIETSIDDPMLYASDITIHTIANRAATEKVGELDIVMTKGVDDGAFVYATPTSANGDEDDILLSRNTVKTINGESIVGSGDITIAGGSGEKGDKGDKGDTGATGVGVQSVKQTTISNTDGGSNVVTVTLTNGTTSTFTVKNGSKGSQGIQGEQGPKGDKGDKGDTGATGTNGTNGTNGKDGADGATFTPSVDSAGNLSWTNNKGLTNPPTVNIKGPKGDKGDAGEGGGSSGGGGVETISLSGGMGTPLIIEEMLAEKRYYLYIDGDADGNEQSIVIGGFEGDSVVDGTHIRHFYAVIECVELIEAFDVSLSLPDIGIHWSTGIPIPIRGAGRYELSITQVSEDGYVFYNAVLTSFSQL